MDEIKLKPCPFCGGDAEMQQGKYQGLRTFYVSCLGCGARTDLEYAEEFAADPWNERVSYFEQASDDFTAYGWQERREIANELRRQAAYSSGSLGEWWQRLQEIVTGEVDFANPQETYRAIADLIDRPSENIERRR